jgi:hypothetical protein
MAQPQDIYTYIQSEEAKFQNPVNVIDGWEWNLLDHVQTSIFYKNGRLKTGNADDKPVKNIVLPILNLEYRAEDIDVKDINLYVDDSEYFHLSDLLKLYHDNVFVVENDIDTFIDEEKEEMIDLGGVLVKDVGGAKPDIVHLQDLAFCNQNNILKNPIGLKHLFSPDQLKEMESRGWGDSANGATATIDDVIALANQDKGDILGQDIKVYEIHGVLPKSYLEDGTEGYVRQFQVVTFYKDPTGDRKGVILFAKEEKENPFKLNKRDNIHNRALGRGGVEELFEDQVWTTYGRIHKKNLLDAASKMLTWTNDETLAAKHPSGLKNLNNLELITVAEGKTIGQIDTYPRNIALFDKWDEEIENHARSTGAAQEAIMGEQPNANTPFKSVEFQAAESHSLHKYRIGKHAKFIEELYRDWFIPYMIKKITQGAKFLSELPLEKLQEIADRVSTKEANKAVKDMILRGEVVPPEAVEARKQLARDEFMKKGDKRFIEILKDEFKGLPIKVKVNVSDKQKAMAQYTDKLVGIFRQIIASVNPQTGQSLLDDPRLGKLFNDILESGGLSPIDYGYKPQAQQLLQAPPQAPQMEVNNPAMMAA